MPNRAPSQHLHKRNTGLENTDWLGVWLLFCAGSASAFHIGKIPTGLPQITAQLGLSLYESSWIVALFSILFASLGLALGIIAGRKPYHHAMITGLVAAGLASLLGSQFDELALILLTRAIEGLGWLLVAVSAPVLMIARGSLHDRPLILGIWGAFVPAGSATILLISPLIVADFGWQGLWQVAGILTLFAALIVVFVCRNDGQSIRHELDLRTVAQVVLRASPWLMFSIFLVYSASFAAITAYFPTLLLDLDLASLEFAGTLAALGITGNIFGNIAAGWLLRHGWTRLSTLTLGLVGFGIASELIFSATTGLSLKVLGLFLFSLLSGLIPGTLFATAPLLVNNPAYVGIINGLILQAAGVGQLVGPPVFSGLVEWSGRWSIGSTAALVVCLFGCAFTYWLHRDLNHLPTPQSENAKPIRKAS